MILFDERVRLSSHIPHFEFIPFPAEGEGVVIWKTGRLDQLLVADQEEPRFRLRPVDIPLAREQTSI